MTHSIDGSFFLLKLSILNQVEPKIHGISKNDTKDGFAACKVNRCCICFLSLPFTSIRNNSFSTKFVHHNIQYNIIINLRKDMFHTMITTSIHLKDVVLLIDLRFSLSLKGSPLRSEKIIIVRITSEKWKDHYSQIIIVKPRLYPLPQNTIAIYVLKGKWRSVCVCDLKWWAHIVCEMHQNFATAELVNQQW